MVIWKERQMHLMHGENQGKRGAYFSTNQSKHSTCMWPRCTSSLSWTQKNSSSSLSSSLEGLFLYFFPFLLQKMRLGPYPTIKTPFFFHFWPPKRLLDSSFSPFLSVHEFLSLSCLVKDQQTNLLSLLGGYAT